MDPFILGIPPLCRYDLPRECIHSAPAGTCVPQIVYAVDNGAGGCTHPDVRVAVGPPCPSGSYPVTSALRVAPESIPMYGRYLLAALAPLLLAGSASAGPITVFTQVWQAGGNSSGEIPISGLGSWAVLTWSSGPGPTVTVPADQISASQPVVGFWPVMGFRDRAHYEAERGTVVTVPETPVTLYAEVWNGEYGGAGVEYRQLFIEAAVSARVSAEAGQNAVDWRFLTPPTQARFGDGTVVSVAYEALRLPDGVPQIQFEDGSPSIGFPGPIYYPTLVEAEVEVARPPVDPGAGGAPGGSATPEPSSALLLAGFLLGGLVGRRRAGWGGS